MINNALLFLFYIHFNFQLVHVIVTESFLSDMSKVLDLFFSLTGLQATLIAGKTFLHWNFNLNLFFHFLKILVAQLFYDYFKLTCQVIRVSDPIFLWQCMYHITQILSHTLINANMSHPTLIYLALINVVCKFLLANLYSHGTNQTKPCEDI